TRDTAAEITVNSGEEVSGVDIRYRDEPGHTISGRVLSSSTTEERRSFDINLISILNGAEQTGAYTYQRPGTNGFMFSGVADGEYEMIAQIYSEAAAWAISDARRIRVNGADITGIELTVKPLASIRGSVLFEESKAAECQGKHRPVL